MKLNTIIKDWPSGDQYNTRYRRAVRAAEKIPLLQGDKINANSVVTTEEIRRIIKVMPKSTPGYAEAEAFLLTHPEGFPEQLWKEYCEEKRVEKSKLFGAIQRGFKDHDKILSDNISEIAELIREIRELKRENRDMKDRIDKLEQERRR